MVCGSGNGKGGMERELIGNEGNKEMGVPFNLSANRVMKH